MTVGGIPCPSLSPINSATSYSCNLPNFDYDPTVSYNLLAFNDAASFTLTGLVQYTSAPTLIDIDQFLDRGSVYYIGAQCYAGTTITLRGSRFPAADAVTVQFAAALYLTGADFNFTLLSPTRINSTVITVELPVLDDATAADVYGQYGYIQVTFTSSSSTNTTNSITTRLYSPLGAPNVSSVTSSMCDSVSALQANCRAQASITIAGSNLAVGSSQTLLAALAGVYEGDSSLLTQTQANATWYDSLTNTSLVFTLAYFDADTNVQLQADVVYTVILLAGGWHGTGGYSWYEYDASNAFRLSLTYNSTDSPTIITTSSSSKLSSGAVAGIVIAAVVVAVLLVALVVWLLRCQFPLWSKQPTREELQWPMRSDGEARSDTYKDVELQRG